MLPTNLKRLCQSAWLWMVLAALGLMGCAPAAMPVMAATPEATSIPRPTLTASVAPSVTPSSTSSVTPSFTPIVPAVATDTCIPVTRTPPPQAPTRVAPDGTVDVVDPHIALCASATTVAAGQVVTLTGLAVDIGLPYYSVMAQDQTAVQPAELARITYGNESKLFEQASQLVQVIDVNADMEHVQVALRALQPGTVQLWINATGEIHYGYPGPATWAGGGSDPIILTITP